ncbi:MAG: NUDIX domain-containing protein [Alphaproteobacteria bacterium]|nr:NUDIX domain-containing protein [Alphaproteobacteria bacterium]
MPKGTGARAVDVLRRETCFQGHMRMERVTFRHTLHGGGWSPPLSREVLERGHAAVVLPYDPARDTVILIEQVRVGALDDPAGAWTLEAVAGIIDAGEAAETAARREAVEETGRALEDLVLVADVLASPGCMTEGYAIFVGRVDGDGDGDVHGLGVEGEDIRVHVVPFAEALAMVGDGRVRVSHTIIALQWLALSRDRIRARWGARG